MFYVYALYNQKHDKIYIGQTKDFDIRLEMHNKKYFLNSYTKRFDGDWSIIYKEECMDRTMALKREKQLKSYRGRQFIKKHIPL